MTQAQQAQTITFAALGNKTWGDPDFTVSATASSGLAVSFAASGNCTVADRRCTSRARGHARSRPRRPGTEATCRRRRSPAASRSRRQDRRSASARSRDKTYGDPDFDVSATASSGLAVSFGASGSCTVSGQTVHLTGAGTCTITASQAGNANYQRRHARRPQLPGHPGGSSWRRRSPSPRSETRPGATRTSRSRDRVLGASGQLLRWRHLHGQRPDGAHHVARGVARSPPLRPGTRATCRRRALHGRSRSRRQRRRSASRRSQTRGSATPTSRSQRPRARALPSPSLPAAAARSAARACT